MNKQPQQGFTLVELAIVLVIIGLVVGGVLAGQTLIRNAEIRSIINDRESIAGALTTFRSRFNALPGDMRDATRYFGAQDADHATCIALTTAPTDTSTCNGNGDKQIGGQNLLYEIFRAWQQMGNAELLPGSFSGVPGADGVLDSEPGWNVKQSDTIDGAGWQLQYLGNVNDSTKAIVGGAWDMFFNGSYGHILYLGLVNPATMPGFGNMLSLPVLSPDEAKALDEKTDDGWPGRGVMRVFGPVSSTDALAVLYQNDCATDSDPDVAEYNIHGNADIECVPIFMVKL